MTADGRRYSAVVLDISPNGVFIQTSAQLAVGAIVDLELNLPGVDGPVTAQARVARLKLVPHELRSVAKGGLGLHIDLPPREFLEYYAVATRAEIPGAAPPKPDVPKPGVARRKPVKARAKPRPRPVKKKKTEIEYRVRLSQIGGNRTLNLVILCDTMGQAEELVERYGGEPLAPRLPPAVYYIPPGGEPVRIEDNMIRPNGIQLSREESTLYISDSNGDHVIAWDIQPNGLVQNRRDFGTLQGRSQRDNGLGGVRTYADGMAVDNEDRLYVATGAGIEVLSSQGAHLGTIPVACPPRNCQNVAFGGPSKQTLYIAGAGSLYSVDLVARGLEERAK